MRRMPTNSSSQLRAIRPAGVLAAVVATLALLLAGCSDDATDANPDLRAGEQAPVAADGLAAGQLNDVPVPSGAEVRSELQDVDGAQTISYVVTASSPVGVQDFYAEQLPDLGWELEERDELGEAVRSFWTMGEVRLLVAASGDDTSTDLSLQLTDLAAPDNEQSPDPLGDTDQ